MKKAFTLIELLVVVLIIGILAAVALPQYELTVEKSRTAELMINLSALYQQIELYYLANGAYPDSLDQLGVDIPQSDNFGMVYNKAAYIGINARKKNLGIQYSLFIPLPRSYAFPLDYNRVCSLRSDDPGTTSIGAKMCKHLCKTSTLITVWGSGEKGCTWKQ